MADPQVSPISQLLYTLGITREDLSQRSDQMRQFLTADDATSRVSELSSGLRSRSNSDLRSSSRSMSISTSLARSLSRASSNSLRDITPPATPVKSEPFEIAMPPRHDTMEAVLERQRRQNRREKRTRKEKEREAAGRNSLPHPPSPSPSNASHLSHNLDSIMQSRNDRRAPSTVVEEPHVVSLPQQSDSSSDVTPQRGKYYRAHTMLGSGSQTQNSETTPTRPPSQTPSQMQPILSYLAHAPYLNYQAYLSMPFNPQGSSSVLPVTPQPRRVQLPIAKYKSPLPPSSPPASSPISTPANRRIVNLVSSPGPMGPLPTEEEYDKLPYVLPPGPYSPNKPDLSYAALVGQAILSSPEHRLTLQEIYDWITIVYPHYKRGETTWMNSIRHVLSTTVCFRKVPRERSVGRTLWAIWDEDLECFKGGGFRKQLCKDIMNGVDAKEKHTGGAKGKPRARKRSDDDDGGTEGRKVKRNKKEQPMHPQSQSTTFQPIYALPSTSLAPHTLFPPTRPTHHHQPYYESCLTQTLPAEIIFPPLPSAAAFNRVVAGASASASSHPTIEAVDALTSSSPQLFPSNTTASSEASFSMSVPELTPNRTSSSPPSSLPSTSDMDVEKTGINNGGIAVAGADDLSCNTSASGEDIDDNVFGTTLLKPVQFWGETPKSAGTLQPGIELLNFDESSEDEPDASLSINCKGKQKQKEKGKLKSISFPPLPVSPSLNRGRGLSKTTEALTEVSTAIHESRLTRLMTPPPTVTPSTPPRSSCQLQISSVRTPISHQGLSMPPTTSASLLHYKSNLDPPPPFPYRSESAVNDEDEKDLLRTPRKRKSSSGNLAPTVTPKRLVFPSGLDDSPFRTPSGVGLGTSPFRTPGSRAIFDPHDPRMLLDEELTRMGTAYEDSPGGIFGKGTGSLLYDSPGLDSPGKWQRYY